MTPYPFPFVPDEFKNTRVLITGGTTGDGAATARSASSEQPNSVLFIKADIGTASGVQTVIERIRDEWGGIDVLVNNVGGTETKPGGFEALTDEDWQNIL